jgi:phosphoglycolate phosphatase-like HAD superfamily hydrolase
MPDGTYLFVDFDDTLCDSSVFYTLYLQEIAALLAGDIGGDRAEWEAAARPALETSLQRYRDTFVGNPLAGYNDWLSAERRRIAVDLFGRAGQPLPAGEPPDEFIKRMQFDALTQVRATFPGAEEALRELFERNVRTQMASAWDSDFLYGALIGAGVESYTESRFGPDLVDCAKEGPEFYQRIFAACEIRPSQAIVVDDLAFCLDWAEEAGAKVVQARLKPNAPEPEFPIVITSLTDLPDLISKLGN